MPKCTPSHAETRMPSRHSFRLDQIIIAKNTSQPTHAKLNRMSGIFPTGGASPTGMSGFCQIVCSLDGEEDSEALSLLGFSSAMRFFSPTAQ